MYVVCVNVVVYLCMYVRSVLEWTHSCMYAMFDVLMPVRT